MPESAVKFGAFEASKRVLARMEGHNDPKKISMANKFTAGGIGGIISQSVCPWESTSLRAKLIDCTGLLSILSTL